MKKKYPQPACNIYVKQINRGEKGRNWRLVVSVQAYYISVLLKTCDCVDLGVPCRLCLVSVERARGSTQGLSSGHLTGRQIRGAQLAPHAWLAHDPGGQDPCLGHVQSCDPLTKWWEGDSHALTCEAASTSPPDSSSTPCNVKVWSPIKSDELNDVFRGFIYFVLLVKESENGLKYNT